MIPIGRRQFASKALGAAAGLALARRAWGSEGRIPPSVVGGLEIGVQSFTFRAFSIEKMVDAMRSVGLSSVELWQGHLDPAKHAEADYRSVKAKLDAAGIRVSAYCVNFEKNAEPRLLDMAFRGAGLLGTSLMTTTTEKSMVNTLDSWAQRFDVTVGFHNHYLSDPWFKGNKADNFEGPEDLLGALKGRSAHLAINLDIGHFSAAGYDPAAFFSEHHERIVSLHVKDRDKDAARSNRPFGKGATPIREVLHLAREVRFPYACNIEWEEDEKDPTPWVQDSFAFIERALA